MKPDAVRAAFVQRDCSGRIDLELGATFTTFPVSRRALLIVVSPLKADKVRFEEQTSAFAEIASPGFCTYLFRNFVDHGNRHYQLAARLSCSADGHFASCSDRCAILYKVHKAALQS